MGIGYVRSWAGIGGARMGGTSNGGPPTVPLRGIRDKYSFGWKPKPSSPRWLSSLRGLSGLLPQPS